MKSFLAILFLLTTGLMVGCSTAPKTEAKRDTLKDDAMMALDRFKADDPTVDDMLRGSRGYAIFPHVGKGGAGVGGAYGRGVLYENGQMVGYCDITQGSVGLQLGGEKFSELIVFSSQDAMNQFKDGKFAFTANVSAVAIKSGAAAATKYQNGVAVFARADKGLMAEAVVGGQKFSYTSWQHAEDGTARTE